MIKGIIALFTSGILTNPLVLLGIISGSVFYFCFDGSQIFGIYKKPLFYTLALVVSSFYILYFRRVYRPSGETDWSETLLAILGGTVKLVFASLLMISFISLFDLGSMSGEEEEDISIDIDSLNSTEEDTSIDFQP